MPRAWDWKGPMVSRNYTICLSFETSEFQRGLLNAILLRNNYWVPLAKILQALTLKGCCQLSVCQLYMLSRNFLSLPHLNKHPLSWIFKRGGGATWTEFLTDEPAGWSFFQLCGPKAAFSLTCPELLAARIVSHRLRTNIPVTLSTYCGGERHYQLQDIKVSIFSSKTESFTWCQNLRFVPWPTWSFT